MPTISYISTVLFCGGTEAIVRQQNRKGTTFLVHREHLTGIAAQDYQRGITRQVGGMAPPPMNAKHSFCPWKWKWFAEGDLYRNSSTSLPCTGIALQARGMAPPSANKVVLFVKLEKKLPLRMKTVCWRWLAQEWLCKFTMHRNSSAGKGNSPTFSKQDSPFLWN